MRLARVGLGAIGLASMGYGLVGLVRQPIHGVLTQIVFLSTVVVGHDLIVLPIALAVGAVMRRFAPGWARGPIHAGLYITAVLIVVAFPFVVGAGRAADNPSALPLNYARGLLIAVSVVWVVVAGVAAVGRIRGIPIPTPRAEGVRRAD